MPNNALKKLWLAAASSARTSSGCWKDAPAGDYGEPEYLAVFGQVPQIV
jgi:hypothetical protein